MNNDYNQQIKNFWETLRGELFGKPHNFIIKELSSSRTSNLKRLNNWTVVNVFPIQQGGVTGNSNYFCFRIRSPKGIMKDLYSDDVVKFM